MVEFTQEEKALLIQSLLQTGLRQPLWEGLINSIIDKLGLTVQAQRTLDHYQARAEDKQKAK